MEIVKFIIIELIAYLCGSIPSGLIVAKLVKNIDIREHGSHNIGSTNVTRTLGKKWGALVLFLDGLKAIIALYIAQFFYNNLDPIQLQQILAITSAMAILGHIFPIWLKFKGGKGIACLLFSLFYLNPILGFTFLCTWIVIFVLFQTSSLSALSAVFVTTFVSLSISKSYFLLLLCIGIITFYKHKDNIIRIINGEELKFGSKHK